MPTQIEVAIQESIGVAAEKYFAMSGGWWLSHAPESYLQMKIADRVFDCGKYEVFVDATYGKIRAELGIMQGVAPKNLNIRPDICVWSKSSGHMKAYIEVKKSHHLAPVKSDCKKIELLLKHECAPRYGYVVAYSEAKGARSERTLKDRFREWSAKTGWILADHGICEELGDDGCRWGHVILKKDNRSL